MATTTTTRQFSDKMCINKRNWVAVVISFVKVHDETITIFGCYIYANWSIDSGKTWILFISY